MEAFEPLYSRVWKFILSISKTNDEARETMSETVLIAYEKYETLRNEKAFLSFLFTIASRITYANRKKRSRLVLKENIEFEDYTSNELSPEEATDLKILYKYLDVLPDVQKEALILLEVFGFNRNEIAEIQGTNLTNVKIRLYRGRKKLEKILRNDNI